MIRLAVRTSPRDEPTVGRTCDSILQAGFSGALLSCDGSQPPDCIARRYGRSGAFPVLRHASHRLGVMPHWRRLAARLLCRDPQACWLVLEDDVLLPVGCADAIRGELGDVLGDSRVGLASLWIPAAHADLRTPELATVRWGDWWAMPDDDMPRRFWGGLALVWRPDVLAAFLADCPGPGAIRGFEIWLGRFLKRRGWLLASPSRSWVRHIGGDSGIGNRLNERFRTAHDPR